MEQEYGFTIEDTPAKVIESDSTVSYTLLISRAVFDAGSFENLVLQVNKSDESITASVLKYNLTSAMVSSVHGSSSFAYNMEATPIVYDASEATAKMGNSCFMVSVLACIYGGTEHFAGEKCENTYPVSIEVCVDASQGGGSSGGPVGGDGPSSPGTPNTGSNPGQHGGGGGNSGGGTVVTSPVTMTPAQALTARKKAFSQRLRSESLQLAFNALPANVQSDLWNFLESSLTNGELTLIASAYPAEAIEFAVQATSALTEGGEVDINNEIILDNTFANNQKAKCVFNKLLSLDSNSYFKNMITSMFASSDVPNIKFSIANLPQGFDAVTLPSAPYIFPGKSLYNITLSENFVANASTAEIALVLIHELIHAELLERLLRMGVISNMSYNASYNATFYFRTTNSMANLDQYFINAIITYYRTSIGDNPDQWNHNMMTDLHYVDKITENLLAIYPLLNSSENDFLTNINSDSNNQTGNYTLNEALGYMSWIGLESTNGYINNIESDTIKLNKKNYIESVARTKFTNNCQ